MKQTGRVPDRATLGMKPGHYFGKRTGFDVDESGRIAIAPGSADAWRDIQCERRAIEAIVETVMRSAAEMEKICLARQQQWFDNVCDDLGIDAELVTTVEHPPGMPAYLTLSKREEPK